MGSCIIIHWRRDWSCKQIYYIPRDYYFLYKDYNSTFYVLIFNGYLQIIN